MLSGSRAVARTTPATTGPARPVERERLGLALERRSGYERLLLTLLYVERMTPAEVGAVLGLTAADVTRASDRLLAGLREPQPRRRRGATTKRRAA